MKIKIAQPDVVVLLRVSLAQNDCPVILYIPKKEHFQAYFIVTITATQHQKLLFLSGLLKFAIFLNKMRNNNKAKRMKKNDNTRIKT